MQKGFAPILLLIPVLILAVLGGVYYFGKLPIKPGSNNPKACTQDAKQCPDGTYVSRSGPNCEFAPCPSVSPKSSDETADWKTYRNQGVDYEFKYPTSLKLIETDTSIVLTDMELDEFGLYPAENNILVEPISDQEGATPTIYRGFWMKIPRHFIKYQYGTYSALHLWELININGHDLYKIEDSFKSNGHEGKYITVVWEDPNKNQYELFVSFNANKQKEYSALFNQIISTFKFTK